MMTLTCQTICIPTTTAASEQLPLPRLLIKAHSRAPPTRVRRRVEDLDKKNCSRVPSLDQLSMMTHLTIILVTSLVSRAPSASSQPCRPSSSSM